MRIEYFGTCEHLHNHGIKSRKCHKRKFEIFDYKADMDRTILICNDYLKVRYNDYSIHTDYSVNVQNLYKDIVNEILGENYELKLYKFHGNKRFNIDLQICWMPINIYTSIPLTDALELIDKCNYGITRSELLSSIKRGFLNLVNYIRKYMRYKTHWKEAGIVKNAIERDNIWDEDLQARLINFLTSVMVKIPANLCT